MVERLAESMEKQAMFFPKNGMSQAGIEHQWLGLVGYKLNVWQFRVIRSINPTFDLNFRTSQRIFFSQKKITFNIGAR